MVATGSERRAYGATTRILFSVIVAAVLCVLYFIAIGMIQSVLPSSSKLLLNDREAVLILGPAIICITAAIAPNLFQRFDGSSIAAIALSISFSVPVYVFLSLVVMGCGLFGDCL
ncbi:MAG TPA: hypothetical protein VHW02_08235 [Rhizomicrobium sp.]|jgi:hypothetical protein|nr:hypothetical protein [Rhizomicrobium sp.]